jgi:hypothetical protein
VKGDRSDQRADEADTIGAARAIRAAQMACTTA